jgi:hypothetical protein
MNKGNHPLQHDENLREALRQEEAALPQMPADLNDRLMKRLHHERRQRHFAVWPWVAAACVAAVMVVLLLPPRESGDETMADSGESTVQTNSLAAGREAKKGQQETKDMESKTMAQDGRIANWKERIANPDTRDRRIAKSTERTERTELKKHSETEQKAEVLLAQEETANQPRNVTASDEIVPADLPRSQAKPQQVVLTERDIPISRPENYRYTPEEIALMRRQANEAYVKWMELEMEIMKYQYEQVAKQ